MRQGGPLRTSSTAVTGICGGDLQARGVGYVLAVARSHWVTTRARLGPARVGQVGAGLSRGLESAFGR